jgi:hypothetical protein
MEEFNTWTQERMSAMGHGPGGFGGTVRLDGPGRPCGMFISWDANHDGAVTDEEFNARSRFRHGYRGTGGG